ncbi:MAG: 4Fe-4S dicluster domain-containing protein [Myxococcales bacterium]|nr:4Fe-4S dicluster domain-containing protein [Myxococcales bacterium]
MAGGTTLLGRLLAAPARAEGVPVRPPTAGDDDAAFQSRCIRCGLCGTVCQNGCIRFFGLDEATNGALTPYLDVRHRSCTLCMRCTNICPTGALTPVEDRLEVIAETVKMGRARVDPDRCISYLGRLCGYCHDACPLPGKAIRLAPPALPVVLDGCVGCGRCVEMCPQHPTAIFIERGMA